MKITMNLLMIVFFTFTGFQLKAEEAKSPYKVIILDDSVDATKLGPHKLQKRYKSKDLPAPERRNSDFIKAGIVVDSGMDELDKDVLWMSAKHSSLIDLQKKYPNIGKDKLSALAVQVKK